MTYEEFKKYQKTQADKFTEGKLFFAFGTNENEVIAELYEKYQLIPSEVIGVGIGAYIKKSEYDQIMKFFEKQANELHEYTMNNLYEVCKYEFWNYELEISLSFTYKSFLLDFGLTETEIEENKDEINRAINDCRKEFYELN